jgi:hypothetical protein
MSPRPELRLTAISGKRPENLDPHFLRDVRRNVVISTESSYDSIDVRRVPQPQLPHRRFIAFHGALKSDLIGLHSRQEISNR